VCRREACEDVRIAYRRWATCAPKDRGLGFATYRAALEREELASVIHSDLVGRMRALTEYHARGTAKSLRSADDKCDRGQDHCHK
jgi:hypothetical protein